jgi:hypothetical protein
MAFAGHDSQAVHFLATDLLRLAVRVYVEWLAGSRAPLRLERH